MATNFPTSLDDYDNPPTTYGQQTLQSGDGVITHGQIHVNHNDSIEAIEAKVGIDGSTDTDSIDYKLANIINTIITDSNSAVMVDTNGNVIVET